VLYLIDIRKVFIEGTSKSSTVFLQCIEPSNMADNAPSEPGYTVLNSIGEEVFVGKNLLASRDIGGSLVRPQSPNL
jgi:hypothetical protein